jgi:trehalose 6-phosphate phosphatase
MSLMSCNTEAIWSHLERVERLWLFLDYDGTLADFAPTPEHVNPDPALIDLLERLAQHPRIRVAMISGRRLGHVVELVPVPGILLAGSYGIELRLPNQEPRSRVEFDQVRPVLNVLKPRWQQLLEGREGFFLEDKGWALALHARFAEDREAAEVLAAARRMAESEADARVFRILGGHKFLEIAPKQAHKGQTVAFLLDTYPWLGAFPLYMGDDDKDEEAFAVVKARDGMAVVVGDRNPDSHADCRLPSPWAARRWLDALLALFSAGRTDRRRNGGASNV